MSISDSEFNSVSQFSHVGWGYLLTTLPILMWGTPVFITACAVTLIAGAKEYWDAHGLETAEVAGSSWEDFAFWCVGIVLALVVLHFKK